MSVEFLSEIEAVFRIFTNFVNTHTRLLKKITTKATDEPTFAYISFGEKLKPGILKISISQSNKKED